ncbi:hypothetical protein HDV01_002523 [Terramyces sp. JEL0728]|nr:hypothetical protein HDV01_002523 [Terramyces sp. JEL0728]
MRERVFVPNQDLFVFFREYLKQRYLWMTVPYNFSSTETYSKAICCMAVYKDTIITGSWDGKLNMWGINNQEPISTALCSPEWFNPTPPTSPKRISPVSTCVFKETVGRWKGKIESIKIDGDLVCIGSTNRFIVLNIKTRTRKEFHLCNISRIDIGDQLVLCSESAVYIGNKLQQSLDTFHNPNSAVESLPLIKRPQGSSKSIPERVQGQSSKTDTEKHSQFTKLNFAFTNIVFIGQIDKILVIMSSLGKIYLFKQSTLLKTIDTVPGILTGQFIKQIKYKIIAGFQDGNIRSWQIDGFDSPVEQLPMLSSLSDRITCLYMQSNMVVGGSWDGRVRIWDLKRGLLTRTLKSDFSSSILCISWIGSKIFTGHYNGNITVWDFESEENELRRKRIKI